MVIPNSRSFNEKEKYSRRVRDFSCNCDNVWVNPLGNTYLEVVKKAHGNNVNVTQMTSFT